MPEPSHDKPQPARPRTAKPTPVREMIADSPAPSVEPDVPERKIERDGEPWTVRVTGRSGRAAEGSTPLLLLGFWKGEAEEEGPSLEAWIVGRTLEDLSVDALEAALAKAVEPPDPERKKPFFADAGQTRRRGRKGG